MRWPDQTHEPEIDAPANGLAQEAFVRIYSRWSTTLNPGGYLRVTLVNTCRNWQRHAGVERAKLSLLRGADSIELVTSELADALAALPYRQRAVLVLRYHAGLSEAEIAHALGIRAGTVKSLAARALARRGTRVFVVLAAAVVLIVGVVAAVQRRSPTAAGGTSTNGLVDWSTQYVAFTARELSIVVDGVTFVGADPAIERHSDPGDAHYQTLEVEWHEHGVEMRLYLYFASDGTDWWMTEMRTYDGRANADWVTFAGERMRTPLGQPYTDDLDLTATDHGVTSHLQIKGLALQAFRTVCTASPCGGESAIANATATAQTATTASR